MQPSGRVTTVNQVITKSEWITSHIGQLGIISLVTPQQSQVFESTKATTYANKGVIQRKRESMTHILYIFLSFIMFLFY